MNTQVYYPNYTSDDLLKLIKRLNDCVMRLLELEGMPAIAVAEDADDATSPATP